MKAQTPINLFDHLLNFWSLLKSFSLGQSRGFFDEHWTKLNRTQQKVDLGHLLEVHLIPAVVAKKSVDEATNRVVRSSSDRVLEAIPAGIVSCGQKSREELLIATGDVLHGSPACNCRRCFVFEGEVVVHDPVADQLEVLAAHRRAAAFTVLENVVLDL